jgi:hypothetical protein
MIKALEAIDHEYFFAVNKTIIKNFKESEPFKEIHNFAKQNAGRHQGGELLWKKVGNLGKMLYAYGDQMRSSHWNAYFEMKRSLAPRVMVGNLDFNRASLPELIKFFKNQGKEKKAAEKVAKDVYFARPFMKLEELAEKKIVTSSDMIGTDKSAALISLVKLNAKKSQRQAVIGYLSKTAQKIIDIQRANPDLMSEEEWQGVWQVYRICKAETKEAIGLFN